MADLLQSMPAKKPGDTELFMPEGSDPDYGRKWMPSGQELRAYQPTWRDKLATWLMGDERTSPERNRLMEGLIGSRGLGETGPSAIDFTPAGIPLGVNDAWHKGDDRGMAMAMMLGPAAKTADRVALSKAEQMLKEGFSRNDIRQATGWFKDAGNNWRFEISDAGATATGKNGTLGNALMHPALYEAYPELKSLPVKPLPANAPAAAQGAYLPRVENAGLLRRWLGGADPEIMIGTGANKGSLLHETQHAVDDIEGALRGMDKANPYGSKVASANDAAYLDAPFEKTARSTQARVDMTDAERAARAPWLDYGGSKPASGAIAKPTPPPGVQWSTNPNGLPVMPERQAVADTWKAYMGDEIGDSFLKGLRGKYNQPELTGIHKVISDLARSQGEAGNNFADALATYYAKAQRMGHNGGPDPKTWESEPFLYSLKGGTGPQMSVPEPLPGIRALSRPELPRQAAVKVNGEVFVGANHGDAMDQASRKFPDAWDKMDESIRSGAWDVGGFVTTSGRFVSNKEAQELANAHNLLPKHRANDRRGLESGDIPIGGFKLPQDNQSGNALSPPGITAYHGSPHDFDRFDMSRIGTGEGAQAYGHGLYFAEAEDVAKTYRNPHSFHDVASQDPGEQAANFLSYTGGDVSRAKSLVFQTLGAGGRSNAIIERLESGNYPKGRMYEVRINAHPDDFLDWDKPLSAQSEKVRGALQEFPVDQFKGMTGGDFFRWTRPEGMDEQGYSNALRDAGIPGIKYLDQGSRSAGEGSRNYVVFDDKIIDIVRKYGVAFAASMYGLDAVNQAMGAAQGQQLPPADY